MGTDRERSRWIRTSALPRRKQLCEGGTTLDDQMAYKISSLQHSSRRIESTLSFDNEHVPAGKRHQVLTDIEKAQLLQPSSVLHRSPCHPLEIYSEQEMLIPSCGHFNAVTRKALTSSMSRPPVTMKSLVELDLNSILHNINLRSDVNFEHDVHFMPITGSRAEEKKKRAEAYWLALAAELQIHLHNHISCTLSQQTNLARPQQSFTPRLPRMFESLRELLEALVPDRDHNNISENLEIPFIMQQIWSGVLDIGRLAKWLASLLKSHCAPIRDVWADQMAQQTEDGSKKGDMVQLVKGIEKLFSILEAMKLVCPTFNIYCAPL
jgi:T-complex protein 11